MTEIDKKRQEIIKEYKLSFAKLLELPKFKDKEVKESLQKINEDLINFIQCSTQLKDKEVMTFDEWFNVHGYYYNNSMWLKNSSINGLPNVLDKYKEYKKRNL